MSTEQKKSFFQGKVVSIQDDKTFVIEVISYKTHPKYQKKVRSTKRYKVDANKAKCSLGDAVLFQPCRPISKEKRFIFVKNV